MWALQGVKPESPQYFGNARARLKKRGRSGHHRDILAGDALGMHEILAINPRVEPDNTEILIECRSRWVRAPQPS